MTQGVTAARSADFAAAESTAQPRDRLNSSSHFPPIRTEKKATMAHNAAPFCSARAVRQCKKRNAKRVTLVAFERIRSRYVTQLIRQVEGDHQSESLLRWITSGCPVIVPMDHFSNSRREPLLACVYFKPSFFPAASSAIDSRMRLSRVSDFLAV
jgi:hypothetical protein